MLKNEHFALLIMALNVISAMKEGGTGEKGHPPAGNEPSSSGGSAGSGLNLKSRLGEIGRKLSIPKMPDLSKLPHHLIPRRRGNVDSKSDTEAENSHFWELPPLIRSNSEREPVSFARRFQEVAGQTRQLISQKSEEVAGQARKLISKKSEDIREFARRIFRISPENIRVLCSKEELDKLAEHVEEDEEEPESEGEGEAEKGESVESQQLHGSFVDEGYGYRSDNEEQGEEGASPKTPSSARSPFGKTRSGKGFSESPKMEGMEAGRRSFKLPEGGGEGSGGLWKSESSRKREEAAEAEKQRRKPKKAQPSPPRLKGAIRLALRKYLCDCWSGQKDDWKGKSRAAQPKASLLPDRSEAEVYERTFSSDSQSLAHNFPFDFTFRVYFPEKFKNLSKDFKKAASVEGLLTSLTTDPFKVIHNPAASDSLLYTSSDRQFILKSVQLKKKRFQKETKFWEKAVSILLSVFNVDMEALIEKDFFFLDSNKPDLGWNPGKIENFHNGFNDYIDYMKRMPNTLLPKIYCLFGIQTTNKQDGTLMEYLFFVQNYLFPNDLPEIRYKFDLKGSTINRKRGEDDELLAKKERTWFDLNFHRIRVKDDSKQPLEILPEPEGIFPKGIVLEDKTWARLFLQIEADTLLLSRLKILDYSFLMGVHLGTVTDQKHNGLLGLDPCRPSPGNKLTLFYGIIDILQTFVVRKFGESTWKEAFVRKDLIFVSFPNNNEDMQIYPISTIIPPNEYQKRFRAYITQVVFHPEDRKKAKSLVNSLRGEYKIEQEIDWTKFDEFFTIQGEESSLPFTSCGGRTWL